MLRSDPSSTEAIMADQRPVVPVVRPHYEALELFCENVVCGDPMPLTSLIPATQMPYGMPITLPAELPRIRRRLVYLGGNLTKTVFRYTCPVCGHTRTFKRGYWSDEIREISRRPRQAPPGGGTQ